MANLTENPASWESGVYQIETTDPVLGGAPNVGTGAGMSNIPHLQLANRTAFLKKVIDDAGLGAAAVPLVTLNAAAARLTGSYRFASTDANTPASGVAGTLEVIAASASAVNQVARDSASTRMWTRFWNGTVWSAWSEIWRTTGVSESIGASGWQRLPSGLIMQWGSVAMPAGGNTVTLPATFPLAFPNAVRLVLPGAAAVASASWTERVAMATAWTLTGFTMINGSTNPGASLAAGTSTFIAFGT